MRATPVAAGAVLVAVLAGGGWVVAFHGDWIKKAPAAEEDEKVETEVPVHVAKVSRATLHRYVDGYGTVTPEPAQDGKPAAGARLSSLTAGVLAEAMCVEGQRVEKGATLFQLDVRAAAAEEEKASAAVGSIRATIARLTSAAEYAEREQERTRNLFHDQLASEKDVRDAELRATSAHGDLVEARAKVSEADTALLAAKTQRSILRITAPIAGTVVRIYVSPGEAVDINPSTIIADLVDLDRLVVSATIPAAELPSLKVGEEVDLDLAGKPRGDAKDAGPPAYHGTLGFLGLSVDPKTDTVPVRIAVAPDAGLRPGQYLRIRIAVEERAGCLAVPAESIAATEAGTVVAVVEGNKAVQKPVQVGLKEGGLVEVQGDGIAEGTTVVAAGAYGLPKETKVKVVGE